MFQSSLTRSVVASATWLAAGCALSPCDDAVIVPSIIVEVRDSLTGSAAAAGAGGRAIDGSFVVALEPHDVDSEGVPLSLVMLSERPGTYTVEVTKRGYSRWERTNVQVDDLRCHAEQVQLTAKLQRAT
jgi:hypothetical protein